MKFQTKKLYRRIGGRVVRMEPVRPDKTDCKEFDDAFLYVDYTDVPSLESEFTENPFNAVTMPERKGTTNG